MKEEEDDEKHTAFFCERTCYQARVLSLSLTSISKIYKNIKVMKLHEDVNSKEFYVTPS